MGTTGLAQTLTAAGIVSAASVEDALQRQVIFGGSLGTNLLEAGLVSEAQLLAALGKSSGLRAVGRWEIDSIPSHVPKLLPLAFAETYHMVPCGLEGRTLSVLVDSDPDPHLLLKVRERLKLHVEQLCTSEVRLHYAMHRLYGMELTPRYRDLLVQLDGEPPRYMDDDDLSDGPVAGDRLLSWGVSSARLASTVVEAAAKVGGLRLKPLLARLDAASDRDTIVDVLLGGVLAVFDYAGLFLVQGQSINGWRSTDPERTERIARISLPVALPSVFQTLYATHGHYLGPLPDNSVNHQYLNDIGRAAPRTAFLAPLLVGNKLAAILFADNGPRGVSPRRVAALLLLAQRSGLCLERLVRRRKAEAARILRREPDGQDNDAEPAAARELPESGQQVPPPLPTPTNAPGEDTAVPSAEAVAEEDTAHPRTEAVATPPPALHGAAEQEPAWDLLHVEPTVTAPGVSAAAGPLSGAASSADVGPEIEVAVQEAEDLPHVGEAYVAFADIDDSPEESLEDWEDVLLDTAVAEETSAAGGVGPQRPRFRDKAPPPTASWDDVLAELDRTATIVPRAAPQTLQVAGSVVDESDMLLDSLDASSAGVRDTAIAKLLTFGGQLDDRLRDRFPGRLALDPLAPNTRLLPLAECSGLLALLAARGPEAAPVVLPHLESQPAVKRFFALYFLLVVPDARACEALARRLYDTQPQNRYMAAEALRRHAREPAYQRIVEGLRDQLKVPVLATQVTTVQVLGQLREPTAVPSLIPLVVSAQRQLADAAHSALAVLCAQAFGQQLGAWQQWWQTHFNRPRAVWLLEGLDHDHASLRRIAHTELQALTGSSIPFDAHASPHERQRGVAAWRSRLGLGTEPRAVGDSA